MHYKHTASSCSIFITIESDHWGYRIYKRYNFEDHVSSIITLHSTHVVSASRERAQQDEGSLMTSFVKQFKGHSYPTLWQLSTCDQSGGTAGSIADFYVPALSSVLVPDKMETMDFTAGIAIIKIGSHVYAYLISTENSQSSPLHITTQDSTEEVGMTKGLLIFRVTLYKIAQII